MELASLVDAYRLVERATKYGVLIVVPVFVAFFLFEVLAGLRVHPFQHTLVGAALCLFFLALLSLSEFMDFGVAYGVAPGVSTLLVTVYGVVYVILRLQDYSLLVGTAGLVLALGAVMWATRRVDWYARDQEARGGV